MTQNRDDLPEFVTELEDPKVDLEPLLRLPELFEASEVTQSSGLDKLLGAVELPPQRYAPFFARMAGLWDLPEPEIEAFLTRLRNPQAFRRTPLRGVRVIEFEGGPKTQGSHVRLVHFAPSVHFPRHKHTGLEVAFPLEGSYTDSSGRLVGPGDVHEMLGGTEHEFEVSDKEACILCVLQADIEFKSPVLRLLGKIFG